MTIDTYWADAIMSGIDQDEDDFSLPSRDLGFLQRYLQLSTYANDSEK